MSNSKRGYFKVAMFEKQRLETEQERVIKMTMGDVTWFLKGQQEDNKSPYPFMNVYFMLTMEFLLEILPYPWNV